MPLSQATAPSSRSKSLVRLLVLTLLVGLAHAALLGGMPTVLGAGGPHATGDAPGMGFVTRMIAPEPQPVAEPAPEQPAPQRAATPKHVTKDSATAPAEPAPQDAGSASSPAPAESPATASDTVATLPQAEVNPAPAPSTASAASLDGVQVAAAGKNAEPARPATSAPAAAPSPPVQLPPSIRLLYDGKGEEKSIIKYAANAELLWQQDGSQYNARLEITYLGFRLRTWTSKGTLDALGLEPIRFGDKPRGAEQATHFQRDKGIISFSANNPDVPLQTGAQDKLSALLQLSALVAGAPERFPAGSVISFQAADAHNAESWNFKVAAPEQLELPGGTVQAIKLAKAATAEYGQGMEVWLAPSMHFLPVRLRIVESSGAIVDLLWRGTEKAE